MRRRRRLQFLSSKLTWGSVLAGCVVLSGCSGIGTAPTKATRAVLTGRVQGGQQPVAGAAIQLWAAGTTGYGSGAVPLIQGSIVSDAGGNFSITATYQCPSAASQVYLTATGGNPGLAAGTVNPALALMTALGPCGQYGSGYTLDPNSQIAVNELTTMAAVYALRAFMTPHATTVGTSATNAVGLANAFAKAKNLVDPVTGQARTTTPAGNGTVPQAELNTLADILAPCVNSDGTGTPCNALFAAAATTAYGAPADTIQAAWAIASSPAHNLAALVRLINSNAPFQPTLATVPTDLTVMVKYAGGIAATAFDYNSASPLAIDASGAIWALGVTPGQASSVLKFANDGTELSPAQGFTGGGLGRSAGIAIDPGGNAWVPGRTNANVVELSSTGTFLSGANGYTNLGLSAPASIALDGSGDAWIGDTGAQSVFKLGPGGASLSGPSGFPVALGTGAIAIDQAGNVWGTTAGSALFKMNAGGGVVSPAGGYGTGYLTPLQLSFDFAGNVWTNSAAQATTAAELTAAGILLSPNPGYPTCSPQYDPYATGRSCYWSYGQPFAMDGAGHMWIASNSITSAGGRVPNIQYFTGVAEVSNSGVVLSPATIGYATPGYPFGVAVDQSGDVWVLLNAQPTTLLELVGAGTPVVQPFSVGVRDGTLGQRPLQFRRAGAPHRQRGTFVSG